MQTPSLTAILEFPSAQFPAAAKFWSAAVGYPISAPSESAVVSTPTAGQDRLVLPDLHVADPTEFIARSLQLGAVPVRQDTHRIVRSPGGIEFVVSADPSAERPAAHRWTDGHHSVIDQICLDIPPQLHTMETSFWADLTGWQHSDTDESEFSRLDGPGPLRMLLQRLDTDVPSTSAHLDFACTDVESEVARQVALGASKLYDGRGWVTMQDPHGLRYCITSRTPGYPYGS